MIISINLKGCFSLLLLLWCFLHWLLNLRWKMFLFEFLFWVLLRLFFPLLLSFFCCICILIYFHTLFCFCALLLPSCLDVPLCLLSSLRVLPLCLRTLLLPLHLSLLSHFTPLHLAIAFTLVVTFTPYALLLPSHLTPCYCFHGYCYLHGFTPCCCLRASWLALLFKYVSPPPLPSPLLLHHFRTLLLYALCVHKYSLPNFLCRWRNLELGSTNINQLAYSKKKFFFF